MFIFKCSQRSLADVTGMFFISTDAKFQLSWLPLSSSFPQSSSCNGEDRFSLLHGLCPNLAEQVCVSLSVLIKH